MCRYRQTDRPEKKQYNQYSSQNTKARKMSQTDAIKYPRDCPHTEYTEHSLFIETKNIIEDIMNRYTVTALLGQET